LAEPNEVSQRTIVLLIFGPIIGLIGLVILGAAVGAYVLLYTSYPFAQIEQALRQQGFEVEGLTGSLNSGVELSRLAKKTPEADIDLKDVRFRYSGLWELMENRRLIIETVEVGQLHLNIRKLGPGKKKPENQTAPDPGANQQIHQTHAHAAAPFIREFGIRKVNLRNIRINTPFAPIPLSFNSIELDNLMARAQDQFFSLDKFQLQGNLLDMIVKDLKYADGKFEMLHPLRGTVKQQVFPGLKKDVTFTALMNIQNEKFIGGMATLFDEKLRLSLDDKKAIDLRIASWTPSEYVETSWPIKDLKLSASAPNFMAAAMGSRAAGSFEFFGVPFVFAPTAEAAAQILSAKDRSGPPTVDGNAVNLGVNGPVTAFHVRGDRVFKLSFQLASLPGLLGPRTTPWAVLESNGTDQPQAAMADLLYGDGFDSLAEDKKQQVLSALEQVMPNPAGMMTAGQLPGFQVPGGMGLPTGLPPKPLSGPTPSGDEGFDIVAIGPGAVSNPSEQRQISSVSPKAEVIAEPLSAANVCVAPSKKPKLSKYTILDGQGRLMDYRVASSEFQPWTSQPLPMLKAPGIWAAVDRDHQKVFVAQLNRIIDVSQNKAFPQDSRFQPILATSGMTFDSRRRRLVIFAGRGNDSIFSFRPTTGEWRLLGRQPEKNYSGISYDAGRDRFYALRSSQGDGRIDRVAVFSGDLKPLKEVPITQPARFNLKEQSLILTAEDGLLVVGVTVPVSARKPASGPSSRSVVLDTGCGEWMPL